MDSGVSVVIDLGSGSIKAELASAEAPKVHPNLVGSHKHKSLLPASEVLPMLAGDAAKSRGLLKLRYPVEHGRVTDWTALSSVFKHVIGDLGIPARDHPMLLTEPPLADRTQRARLAELIFEDLGHPAVLFGVQGVLSLFASGQTTGVVLDVGDGVTQACPVVDGYSIRDATKRVDFGGRDVTRYMQLLLRQHGTFLDTSAEFEIVREIKETQCYVQSSRVADSKDVARKHRLPDGTEISLQREMSEAPELLFDPSLHGFECPSVVQTVSDCVKACDIDLRRQLYESVFLSGGATMIPQFCDRFLPELARVTPRSCTVRVHAPADRHLTAWTGASFLAQLSSFRDMITSKQDYNEHGKERLLHSRLFA
jgi:centractin